MIKDNLNPIFQEYFTVAFQFEKHQRLRFEVLDIDPAGLTEFIGYIETKLGVIMGKKDQTLEIELKNDTEKGKRGQIVIVGNPVKNCNANAEYQIKCKEIANVNKSFFGICSNQVPLPVKYEIARQVAGTNHFVKVYTSSVRNNTRSPVW